MTPGSIPPTERRSAPGSAAPVSVEVRRQTVLDAAKAYVCGVHPALVAATLRPLGIDLLTDPAVMAAVSVIGDCWRFNVELSPRAFRMLGCEEAP